MQDLPFIIQRWSHLTSLIQKFNLIIHSAEHLWRHLQNVIYLLSINLLLFIILCPKVFDIRLERKHYWKRTLRAAFLTSSMKETETMTAKTTLLLGNHFAPYPDLQKDQIDLVHIYTKSKKIVSFLFFLNHSKI